jgi:signal transduction histidine kinase
VKESIRTLPRILRCDAELLLAVGVIFSVTGGVLQELHRIEGAGSIPTIVKQVGSNLIVTVVTLFIALMATWIRQEDRPRLSIVRLWRAERALPMWGVVVGGAVGGLCASLATRGHVDLVLIATSAVWMLMAGILVRVIGGASRRIDQQAVELTQAVVDLRESRLQLAEADTDLRRSLSEFLHGSVQTDLIGLERQARLAGELGVAEKLENFRLDIIRDISHQLHPLVIEVGLVPALDELIARTPIDAVLEVSPDVLSLDDFGDSKLPMRLRLAIYRVAQEGLLNASTGGNATQATVRLMRQAEHLVLTVTDDGVGLAPCARRGVGLNSIDAWVRGLGGDWSLDGGETGGALLVASLPLTDQQN